MPIRIGTHISIAADLVMQKKPEILQNLGKTYDINWVRFSGGGDAAPALAAGQIDGGLATPFPFTNVLFQSHVPVTIVHQLLSFGVDGYYDDTTVVRADGGINSVADLKGKIFGVNAIGSTVEQNMRIMARKSGLDPDRDITIVEGRPPFLPAMVRDNKVQAATLFQPFYKQAMAKGDLKVLFQVKRRLWIADRLRFHDVRQFVPQSPSADSPRLRRGLSACGELGARQPC